MNAKVTPIYAVATCPLPTVLVRSRSSWGISTTPSMPPSPVGAHSRSDTPTPKLSRYQSIPNFLKALLAAVAFKIIIADILPPQPYLSYIEIYMLGLLLEHELRVGERLCAGHHFFLIIEIIGPILYDTHRRVLCPTVHSRAMFAWRTHDRAQLDHRKCE